jgi:hypothetical protein
MSKLFALPSPRGTNLERLFSGPLGAASAAFDAAPRRRARDAAPDPDDLMNAMSGLQTHLKSKLTGDDFGTANELLTKLLNLLAPQDPDDDSSAGADPDAEDRRRKMAGDARRGLPLSYRSDPRSLAVRFGDLPTPTQLSKPR